MELCDLVILLLEMLLLCIIDFCFFEHYVLKFDIFSLNFNLLLLIFSCLDFFDLSFRFLDRVLQLGDHLIALLRIHAQRMH